MMISFSFRDLAAIFVASVLFINITFGAAPKLNNKILRREIVLDPEGRYTVGFEVDSTASSIEVDVTVRTTGYVGFGISDGGGMDGSDIVIGGVHTNGSAYFQDYHGLVGNPVEDEVQNWELLEASENSTHTFLRFSRLLDTLDTVGDVPITDSLTNIIWSLGPTDRILYHGPNRGNYSIKFLDPEN